MLRPSTRQPPDHPSPPSHVPEPVSLVSHDQQFQHSALKHATDLSRFMILDASRGAVDNGMGQWGIRQRGVVRDRTHQSMFNPTLGHISSHHQCLPAVVVMTPRNNLPHRRAKDQSLEEACAHEAIAAVQSRPCHLARCVQVAILHHAPLAAPDDFTIHRHEMSVEVGHHAATSVVQRGHDGYSPLNADGGGCSRRPREMDRGQCLMTVAVGVAAAACGSSASSGCG